MTELVEKGWSKFRYAVVLHIDSLEQVAFGLPFIWYELLVAGLNFEAAIAVRVPYIITQLLSGAPHGRIYTYLQRRGISRWLSNLVATIVCKLPPYAVLLFIAGARGWMFWRTLLVTSVVGFVLVKPDAYVMDMFRHTFGVFEPGVENIQKLTKASQKRLHYVTHTWIWLTILTLVIIDGSLFSSGNIFIGLLTFGMLFYMAVVWFAMKYCL